MPELSLVVKVTDRLSDAMNKMSSVTKSFSKNAEQLEDTLHTLTKNKYELKADVKKAKEAMIEAEKQFEKTHSAADGLKMELAQANYDGAVRQLKVVTKAAGETEKAISKAANRANSFSIKAIGDTITSTAFIQQLSQDLSQLGSIAATQAIGSALGSDAGTIGSAAISSALSWGTMGFMVGGPVGAVIGAGVGGILGGAQGALQVAAKKDDYFKSYYKSLYETTSQATEDGIATGVTIAAQREKDLISFSTLFGDEDTAKGYLMELVGMANSTPFLYDDLTAMSKTLATYGYDADSILPALQSIGDAGAALGMSTSDMTMVATAIGRMNSSDKATLEYLNILNDRGINAVEILAKEKNVSVGDMYSMISKGTIKGKEAAGIILNALGASPEDGGFAGSMKQMSQTYEGLTSTRQGLQQEIENAGGATYTEKRKEGINEEITAYGGELGEALKTVAGASGMVRAHGENLSEEYTRQALSAVLLGKNGNELSLFGNNEQTMTRLEQMADAYEKASAEYADGNLEAGLKMESLKEEAETLAAEAYKASDWYKENLSVEQEEIEAIRNNTAALDAWREHYEQDQEYTKGLSAANAQNGDGAWNIDENGIIGEPFFQPNDPAYAAFGWGGWGYKQAAGLTYVPYDNFPALLHQGERVLTAEQARAADRGAVSVQVSGNTFVIREDADVDRVAAALLEKLRLAADRG